MLLFNDNLDNQNLHDPNEIKKKFGQRGASYMAVATVNDDGTWTKGTVINHDDSTVYLMPTFFLQIAADETIMYGERENHSKMVRLKY